MKVGKLKYGVNPEGELITIEEVNSGKTNLVCPFCDRDLTAKKGKIKQHHFAHSGETCLRVRRGKLPSLPLYDNFHLYLSAKHFQLLKDLWREYGHTNYAIMTVPFELEMKQVFNWTQQGYYFNDLGKIPVGGLSLSAFNQIQEPLIQNELDRLTNTMEVAKAIGGKVLQEKKEDLFIYQQQVRRILQLMLYFLEIKTKDRIIHKIGVTRRLMSDRLKEIRRDLSQHYQELEITVLNTWKHRGNVELYFKHRYQQYNYPIGKLTEYYSFEDADLVLQDLRSMQPKILSPSEIEILQSEVKAIA